MSRYLQENLTQAQADALLTRGVLARRFFAFLVDLFLIGILSWILAIIILVFGVITFGVGWLLYHIIPVVPFVYYTLLVGGGDGTPGQRLFGITVRQDADLRPPGFAQAFVWSLLLWISFLLAFIPFAVALFTPRHRAAHDLLSGLVLIRI